MHREVGLRVVEGRVALNLADAVDADRLRQPVVKILTALDLGGLSLIASGFHLSIRRRLDANIDIFREPVDDPKPLESDVRL